MPEAPFSKASTDAINLAATNLHLLTLLRRDIDPTVRFTEGFDAATVVAEHATQRALAKHLRRLLQMNPDERATRLVLLKPLPVALRIIYADSKSECPLLDVYQARRLRRGYICAECGDLALDNYMVTDPVWHKELGLPRVGVVLHLPCLAARLPRELTLEDFPVLPVNDSIRWALKQGARQQNPPDHKRKGR